MNKARKKFLAAGFLFLLGGGLFFGGLQVQDDLILATTVGFALIAFAFAVPLFLGAVADLPRVRRTLETEIVPEEHAVSRVGRGILGGYARWRRFRNRFIYPLLLLMILSAYLYYMFEEELRACCF